MVEETEQGKRADPLEKGSRLSALAQEAAVLRRALNYTPVAAIGASAGGLEPIESFFDSMPADSGCAFIIIQHLSPDFRSLMDELLARHSSMEIRRVVNGMVLQPNCIYLNPARSVMTIVDNTLFVENIDSKDNVYLPIDLFFESLAKARGEDAIALVLSGTGTDGTRGARYIVRSKGTVLVQDPETTRFDGMPKSLIAEGSYQQIGNPKELAESVLKILRNEKLPVKMPLVREPIEEPLSDLISMLKHRYGTDFEQYKETTIKRRIERRAQMHQIKTIDDYRDLLNFDQNELDELYSDMLIEVTSFFRDQEAFDILRDRVVPKIMENMANGDSLRVWVPGCASGEEAYSLGILLQEEARTLGLTLQIKILATDVHERSTRRASAGIYPKAAVSGIPEELVNRYFDIIEEQVQIKSYIRNMVFFSVHDVMKDPPFSRINLVTCRNLLIYLKEEAQDKVISLLHFALNKNGYLMLGPSEHIGRLLHEFDTVNEKWRVFRKKRDIKLLPTESIFQRADISKTIASPRSRPDVVRKVDADGLTEVAIASKRAHRLALEQIVSQYAPPGFLLSSDGTVIHIFGDAGHLLPMQSGVFSRYLIDLIRPDLKTVVSAALEQSKKEGFKEFRRLAYVKSSSNDSAAYEVLLKPVTMPEDSESYHLLSMQRYLKFSSVERTGAEMIDSDSQELPVGALQQRIVVLEQSLRSSEESLQSTIEELETSNEELQSTNEELMSTNEELQSTNEELHSVNEELYTVSAEHQRKNEELIERDCDIETLLDLSKIGTLHLDNELVLIRFTDGAKSVFNIINSDIGRPFHHITLKAQNTTILEFVNEVKRTRISKEVEIRVGSCVYLVRISSNHSEALHLDGVLLSVIDVTDLHTVKCELEKINHQYKDIVKNTGSFIVTWDASSNKIIFCNEQYAARQNVEVEDLVGKNILEVWHPDERGKFQEYLEAVTADRSFREVVSKTDWRGNTLSARVIIRGITSDGDEISHYQVTGYDCTDEEMHKAAVDRLTTIFSNTTNSQEEKLIELLNVGLDYFNLHTATISLVSGNELVVRNRTVRGTEQRRYLDRYDLDKTVESLLGDEISYCLLNDVSSQKDHPISKLKIPEVESFAIATIRTTNGPFGALAFTSEKPRRKDFTVNEEGVLLLLAGWAGHLLGNIEQQEFSEIQNGYFRSMFLEAPVMLFLSDLDGLVISVSELFAKRIGKDAESLLGGNCLDYFKPANRKAVASLLADVNNEDCEATLVLEDGSEVSVLVKASVRSKQSINGSRIVVLSELNS